jgi:ABC-type nitrate/sulfonate/bicarbonate transport system substrate-binding protein
MLRRFHFILALCVILTACNTAAPTATPAPTPIPTKITLQLSWLYTIEYGGIYEAIDKGYYKAGGLDVSLTPGGFDEKGNIINPLDGVTSGKAEFGIAGSDAILTERAKGAKLVAIATIYQRNPLAFMSLATSNIKKPADLVGKRIRTEPGTGTDINMTALLKKHNIERSQIKETFLNDPTVEPLIKGEVDVIPVFITNEPIDMKARGIAFDLILPSDYGIDVYSNVIFTTEDMIKNKPDVVENFLRATMKGWKDAIDKPEEAAKLSVARDSTLKLANETASMQASIPLLSVPGRQIGTMKVEDWDFIYQTLQSMKLLTAPLDVKAAYNLSFLDKIYKTP